MSQIIKFQWKSTISYFCQVSSDDVRFWDGLKSKIKLNIRFTFNFTNFKPKIHDCKMIIKFYAKIVTAIASNCV